MMKTDFLQLLTAENWFYKGSGARYQQLYLHLKEAILNGHLKVDTQLPPERDMAVQAGVSRVTIRKAIKQLAADGYIDQRWGSGSYIRLRDEQRLTQNLSSLVSFTESMKMRGYTPSSKLLSAGVFPPTPQEIVALGLDDTAMAARIKRLRIADPGALAIETSVVPATILPNPKLVTTSLYAVLRRIGMAPVRAVQRVSAVNLNAIDAELLDVPAQTAFLKIERTSYLSNGRPVEFSSGVYRSDIYDFVSQIRMEPQ